ncbi:MAG: hypothetical protein WC822_07400 [Candidatus Paceibacterota bacterium]|jgi:hypothetical protein
MDISKVRIGACQITYKGVNVGHTLDGVELTFEREFEDLTVDKYGSSPVDKALTGNKLMAKFKLAQPDFASLNIANPEGEGADGTTGDRIGLGTEAGYLLRQDAGELILRPLKNVATAVDTEDVVLYKAVSVENIELSYKVDEQRVIEVTFEALVDETYGVGRRLGHVGPSGAIS